jgi:hypothetical protein
VQLQIEIADAKDGGDQKDSRCDHQHVGLAGFGDVKRQIVRRHRVKLFVQSTLPELRAGDDHAIIQALPRPYNFAKPQQSNLTALVVDFHVRHPGKQPLDPVLLDHVQLELDAGQHDVACTACDNIHRLTIVFFRLDDTFGSPSDQPVRFGDKSSAMQLGHRGECDLVRLAVPHEDVFAFIRAGRPGIARSKEARIALDDIAAAKAALRFTRIPFLLAPPVAD